MNLSIIVAMAANRVIGRNNSLPWRLPADLKRFKSLTMGHHLLMGRKTFESIGRPLPGRKHVVITRRQDYAPEGVLVAHSVEEAVELARRAEEQEAFVAGGAEIYRQTLDRADRMYLTLIDEDFEGDAYFPEYDESQWLLVSREDREPDGKNSYSHSFRIYARKR